MEALSCPTEGKIAVKKDGVLKFIKKRDARVVAFNKDKISQAIFNAAQAVGGEDKQLADELADVVALYLKGKFQDSIAGIEEIQDVVEKVLIETGHAKTAKAYILYREKRNDHRNNIKIRKQVKDSVNSTDLALLVAPITKDEVFSWNKARISESLVKDVGI